MQDQPGPRAIGEFSQRLTKKHMGRRGFAEASLVADWACIVGEAQSLGSLPLKITFPAGERTSGTLHVRVASGGLATEFSHLEPLILQRVNGYFGYGAVARLKLTQGPVPPRPPKRRAKPAPVLPPERERALQDKLAGVEDPELRDALARLGRNLAGDR